MSYDNVVQAKGVNGKCMCSYYVIEMQVAFPKSHIYVTIAHNIVVYSAFDCTSEITIVGI